MGKMINTLKYHGKGDNSDKTAALDIYKHLTTSEQRHAFVTDFYDPAKGNNGKNLKAVIRIHRSMTAEDKTVVAATEDFLTRHCSAA